MEKFGHIGLFVITERVKHQKKVQLGTGTKFQVPVLMSVQM